MIEPILLAGLGGAINVIYCLLEKAEYTNKEYALRMALSISVGILIALGIASDNLNAVAFGYLAPDSKDILLRILKVSK